MNPFDPYVVQIILDLPPEKREEAYYILGLVVPAGHIERLKKLVALEIASRN